MPSIYPWNESQIKEIEGFIAELEKETTVEFILVFSRSSGNYNDVKYMVAYSIALFVLFFVLFSPFDFSPGFIPPIIILTFFIGVSFCNHFPVFLRLFIPFERMHENVTRAAQATFIQQKIHLTRERTGLLLYISQFENFFEVLIDSGARKNISLGALQKLLCDNFPAKSEKNLMENPGKIKELLQNLSKMMAVNLPAKGENPDEIPNRPIFL
ncbi:hypothetical protein ACFL35_21000 [Candidatus Riflebacteria bacterium]